MTEAWVREVLGQDGRLSLSTFIVVGLFFVDLVVLALIVQWGR